jgi:hypothetical protein
MKPKMKVELILVLASVAAVVADSSFSVTIDDDIPVESCAKVLANLEVIVDHGFADRNLNSK